MNNGGGGGRAKREGPRGQQQQMGAIAIDTSVEKALGVIESSEKSGRLLKIGSNHQETGTMYDWHIFPIKTQVTDGKRTLVLDALSKSTTKPHLLPFEMLIQSLFVPLRYGTFHIQYSILWMISDPSSVTSRISPADH